MLQTMVKIKNGAIALPKQIQNAWNKEDEAMLFSSNTFVIVKKVEKAVARLSDIPEYISTPKMPQGEIAKEIRAYRAGK